MLKLSLKSAIISKAWVYIPVKMAFKSTKESLVNEEEKMSVSTHDNASSDVCLRLSSKAL